MLIKRGNERQNAARSMMKVAMGLVRVSVESCFGSSQERI